jgi:hypothetical protein
MTGASCALLQSIGQGARSIKRSGQFEELCRVEHMKTGNILRSVGR